MTTYERPRIAIRKNTGASDIGDPRARINLVEGTGITITATDVPASDEVQVTFTGPSGGAPSGGTYVTMAAEAGLSAERVLTAGSGLALTDGGAGAAATLAALSYVFDQVTANVTVGNTAVETTIYTKQIPGATLGTTKGLRLTIMGTLTDSALDASTTMTFRFKFGATTLVTLARTTDDGVVTLGGTAVWRFVFEVFADGATNAQLGWLSGVCVTISGGVGVNQPINVRGTAAIDDTANQNLVVTAQWNAGTANATLTMERAVVELL